MRSGFELIVDFGRLADFQAHGHRKPLAILESSYYRLICSVSFGLDGNEHLSFSRMRPKRQNQ